MYALRRQVNVRILWLLFAGGLPGVLGGALLLDRMKRGPYNNVLYAVLGSLIVASAAFHLYRVFRPKPRPSEGKHSRLLPFFAFPIGAEVGFSSAGAGALGSLLLLGLTPLTTAEVIGTDLCFGLGVSMLGGIIQFGAGNYDGALLVKLLIGGLCGTLTASLIAGRIAQRPLRVGLLVMLMLLGFQLALHGYTFTPEMRGAVQASSK